MYNNLSVEISKELENKTTLVICQDGGSSVQNDPTIAHSVYDGKKSFLHSIVDFGAEKKTADYCFTILNEAIVQIKIQYGKDVFAICTDNEARMVKIRKLALKEYTAVLTWMQCSLYKFAGKRFW